ncbi:hypothetical protein [Elizabethkingia anophelis]|uniref:hypothetical protein n=1 Tax=Elizabethkingia anophelis TaxID=1117645 RepID=UPI002227FA3D|nr:hypothetical protein [Elizabethkingia anophelis]MCW2462298.1 hypothetical protein [Elizabethkingia anophelis]MCW2465982.1 hypothetical protein [Elizabethkingia anophelis]MCW2469667.1 hypothetical protein [Elizabethkingia anophelis]MDV3661803.1 hypothetical protein [Elizabethkingia anophelis]MDV3774615.1 hypothetical protein [Elizabethkingia anophelis]
MKRALHFFILIIVTISCTNYYTVLLNEDTPIYSDISNHNLITTIPGNTKVYLAKKNKKNTFQRVKWEGISGWVYQPSYSLYSSYNHSSYSDKTSYSGGTIHVRGYYRKDGTYVSPYTRRSSKR